MRPGQTIQLSQRFNARKELTTDGTDITDKEE